MITDKIIDNYNWNRFVDNIRYFSTRTRCSKNRRTKTV